MEGRNVRTKISDSSDDGPDRISDLVDDVLVQILVLLPLVEAVRTCVLSSRWRRVWTRLPRLKLDDDDEDSPAVESFADLVAGVMTGYATDVHMPDVSISASAQYDYAEAFHIAASAFLGAERAISAFDVYVFRDEQEDDDEDGMIQVPLQMPCFPWVKDLALVFIGMELRMPHIGTFARLTKLYIAGVRFTDGGWALYNVVSWRCPCLKDLELGTIQGLRVLIIISNSLLSLRLLCLMDLERLQVVGTQLRDMQVRENFMHSAERRHMLLHVPKLEQFLWEDRCPDNIHLWSLPRELLRLTVVLPLHLLTARDGGPYQFVRILQTFKNIKTLSLNLSIAPESAEQNNLIRDADISFFRELDLTVKRNEHTFGPTVLSFLNRNYWVKKFSLEIIGYREGGENMAPCASNCDCREIINRRGKKISLDYLNRVVMKNFSGTEDETDFLFSIVKNAKELHNISIVSSMDIKTAEKFIQALKKQAPSGCTIEFATISS